MHAPDKCACTFIFSFNALMANVIYVNELKTPNVKNRSLFIYETSLACKKYKIRYLQVQKTTVQGAWFSAKNFLQNQRFHLKNKKLCARCAGQLSPAATDRRTKNVGPR